MLITKYKGRIIEVVEEEKKIPNSNKTKVFEYARRSPGVRAIIIDRNKRILLTKEFRYELNDYDFRLPGGKVFDSLEEYIACDKAEISNNAKTAVIKESLEEVGLIVKNPKLLHISKAGATVEWDLYYFEIKDFKKDVQHLEEGEIIDYDWYSAKEIEEFIINNKMSEDRSVGVLLKYILQNNSLEL